MSSQLPFTCVWEWLVAPGRESFSLRHNTAGWILQGAIETSYGGPAAGVHYQIHCDQAWHTQSVAIELTSAQRSATLHITVDNRRWTANGQEITEVEGCVDVDLGWTPSTNTLPIRRLNLPVRGDSGILNAAWVRFPELTMEILPQRYQRLAPDLYRYSSNNGNFVADIRVDPQGVAVEYEGFWRRL